MSATAPSASPAALSSFLRGIERRALAFSQALSGSPVQAQEALREAVDGFRKEAGALPLRQWPLRFWTLLLGTPALRREAPEPDWPEGLAPLAQLPLGPRAALLLRMAAGLDLPHLAEVLRVSESAARLALARAVAMIGGGEESGSEGLRQLDAALQAQLRRAPPPGQPAAAMPAPAPRTDAARGLRRLLWVALGLVAAMFAATYLLWPEEPPLVQGQMRPLPGMAAPGARPTLPGQAASALASPDYELLADPEGRALAEDLAFLSWLAGRLVAMPEEAAEARPAEEAAPTVVEEGE